MANFDKIQKFLSDSEQTLLSLVKIALQSRRPSKLPAEFRNPDELVILANGPSLNKTVERHAGFLEDKTLLAVNFCATSDIFTTLRPELYLIADPLFWIVDEKRERLFCSLAEKTTWPMQFFIPAKAKADNKWPGILAANPNIRVNFYNATPVEGYRWFTNFAYSRGLGLPRPHNVLIPSIAIALRLPFKRIYLAGADHSWLPEITVTDDNVVLMHQKHFYDQDSSKADTVKQENLQSSRLHTIMYHMHVAFRGYFILLDYARHLGKRIINITKGSYIDAFERLDLDKLGSDGIVIQARSGSTRMPSKILRPFDGERRIIDILLERIKAACPGLPVIVATTLNPADDAIEDIARQHGALCWRGSEDDVLDRFIGAAEHFGLRRIIRVCSDNPFLQAESFKAMLQRQSETGADYVGFCFPDGRPTIKSHLGLYAELATVDALRRAAKATPERLYHEHVTNYLYSNPQEYKVDLMPLPELLNARTDLRLTLDTPSDFELLKEIYRRLETETDGSLQALIDLVDANPAYGAIMKQNIAQNEK